MEINSIEEFIEKSELFKAGKIVPAWLLRLNKRKLQHKIKFGLDCYVLKTIDGAIAGSFLNGDNSALFLIGANNVAIAGCPHSKRGGLIVNLCMPNSLEAINHFIQS